MATISFVGRFGRSPELKETPNGNQVVTFSLAERTGKDKPPNWWECLAWNKLGTDIIMKFCKKGDLIYISGEVNIETWENDAGEKRSKAKVTVNKIELLGSSEQRNEETEPRSNYRSNESNGYQKQKQTVKEEHNPYEEEYEQAEEVRGEKPEDIIPF